MPQRIAIILWATVQNHLISKKCCYNQRLR
jgi:hypothetical protein